METFLLIVCVALLPSVIQGLPTKHKEGDILVKKVTDRLIQQHGIEDPKKKLYTAIIEEITNAAEDGGKDALIKGIRSFIEAKRFGHAGSGIVKRSTYDMGDLHARGTSTTPKPPSTSTPPEYPTSPVVETSSAPATTSPAIPVTTTPLTTTPPATTTPPLTTTPPATTTPATTTTELIIDYSMDDYCMLFGCFDLMGDHGLVKDYYLF